VLGSRRTNEASASATESEAAGAAPDAALGGGSGGALSLDGTKPGALPRASCRWLAPYEPDASVANAEVWCNPGSVNPSACPTAQPKPGSACTDLGLDCKYALDADAIIVTRCEGTWQERGHHCHRQCAAPDAGTLVPLTGKACGQLGVLQCGVSQWATQQELLDGRLREAAKCCGLGSEGEVTLYLKDGCATAVVAGAKVADCLRDLLEGHRIECAEGLSCAGAVVTTLM
jgi:hypothetical protein